jgi:hypothetical protein
MYLVILNGEVVGSHDDEPSEVAEGAELAHWEGDAPTPRIIDGVVYWALDPRDDPDKLKSAKWRKLEEINKWDNAVRLAGVEMGQNFLRYDEVGQNRMSTLMVQIRELVEQGVITGDTLVAFDDANGDLREAKASAVRSFMQTYFIACQMQARAVGDLIAQLKAASTIQEVEAIVVE